MLKINWTHKSISIYQRLEINRRKSVLVLNLLYFLGNKSPLASLYKVILQISNFQSVALIDHLSDHPQIFRHP